MKESSNRFIKLSLYSLIEAVATFPILRCKFAFFLSAIISVGDVCFAIQAFDLQW